MFSLPDTSRFMTKRTALTIAQDLIRINTVNPPGNEAAAISYLGALLEDAGFSCTTHRLAEGRTSLISTLDGTDDEPPVCFTGHVDTVLLGSVPWSFDPFGAEIMDGKLCGRGSTDMKGGVGAIVAAALRASALPMRRGLKLVFTAGEETGCEGAQHLAQANMLGQASAIVVAEPTQNAPLLGHRGALWLHISVHGRAAHGSKPELGDNAVTKAARAVLDIEKYQFKVATHAHLGRPTMNIGYLRGGGSVNIVPDCAEVGLDIRTVPGLDHTCLCQDMRRLARDAEVKPLLDLPAVFTPPDNPWYMRALSATSVVTGKTFTPAAATFFTDASVLAPRYGNPPVIILGPGNIDLAHCVDETCDVDKIEQAEEIFTALMQV